MNEVGHLVGSASGPYGNMIGSASGSSVFYGLYDRTLMEHDLDQHCFGRARVINFDSSLCIGLPRIPDFYASSFSTITEYGSNFHNNDSYVPIPIGTSLWYPDSGAEANLFGLTTVSLNIHSVPSKNTHTMVTRSKDCVAHSARVSWTFIRSPKLEGGLGLRDLEVWNKVCILHHIQSILAEEGSPWIAWIKEYVMKMMNFWNVVPNFTSSWKLKELAAGSVQRIPISSKIVSSRAVGTWDQELAWAISKLKAKSLIVANGADEMRASLSQLGNILPIPTLFRQLEQEMETVIKVLQPGPLGIIEHKFSAEEIREANATVRKAVENWRRNAIIEHRNGILKDYIHR
ncbi:hypothetical protein Golob_023850 [Gossypium lobatum]|uniref:Uncharacterized protein n=6 Tax=Gossypium TaxID=3633 RepID=A0A7J8NLF1_9ROSI|nr:hypothetical protein [Gossypium lobatum]